MVAWCVHHIRCSASDFSSNCSAFLLALERQQIKMFQARIMIATSSMHVHDDDDDDKALCVIINCKVWIKMTLRLKASDWRKRRGSWATHNRPVRRVLVGWETRKTQKKWREAARREGNETMYNLWLFFTSFHRSFLQHATSVFVFNLLVDFRYYRWKKNSHSAQKASL